MTVALRSDRGVSQVIGVTLLVAIVVVLAAILGAMAFGFTAMLTEPQHPVTFDTEWVSDGDGNAPNGAYFVLTYTGGEPVEQDRLVIKDDAGHRITWDDVWTTNTKPVVENGDYVHIDGVASDGPLDAICEAGQTYYFVVEHEGGETTIIDEFEVPSAPTATASEC